MSPAPVVLEIGPQDPDSTAGFGHIGAGQTAKQLLQRHAAQHPRELMDLLNWPVQQDATDAIDVAEVAKLADVDGEVTGAKVRGEATRPGDWIVTFIYLTDSGRSARGVVSYEQLSASRDEYQRRLDAKLYAQALEGRSAGEPVSHDPERVKALEDELARLRAEQEDLRAAQEDPEPIEGYDDSNVDDVMGYVNGLDLTDPEEYVEAKRILEYEREHEARKGIVEPVTKLLADEDEQREAAAEALAAQQQGSEPESGD